MIKVLDKRRAADRGRWWIDEEAERDKEEQEKGDYERKYEEDGGDEDEKDERNRTRMRTSGEDG